MGSGARCVMMLLLLLVPRWPVGSWGTAHLVLLFTLMEVGVAQFGWTMLYVLLAMRPCSATAPTTDGVLTTVNMVKILVLAAHWSMEISVMEHPLAPLPPFL